MIIKPTTNGTWIHFCRCFLGKLKAQHFSSPSSRLVENNINTSGSGGLSSSFTSGCLEKYLLSIIRSLVGKIFTFHLTQTTLVLMSRWNFVYWASNVQWYILWILLFQDVRAVWVCARCCSRCSRCCWLWPRCLSPWCSQSRWPRWPVTIHHMCSNHRLSWILH